MTDNSPRQRRPATSHGISTGQTKPRKHHLTLTHLLRLIPPRCFETDRQISSGIRYKPPAPAVVARTCEASRNQRRIRKENFAHGMDVAGRIDGRKQPTVSALNKTSMSVRPAILQGGCRLAPRLGLAGKDIAETRIWAGLYPFFDRSSPLDDSRLFIAKPSAQPNGRQHCLSEWVFWHDGFPDRSGGRSPEKLYGKRKMAERQPPNYGVIPADLL